MNLKSQIELTSATEQAGKKFRVVDSKYGHLISEHDNPEDAEQAARARPYSKVLSQPNPATSQHVRDVAIQKLAETNPDVD